MTAAERKRRRILQAIGAATGAGEAATAAISRSGGARLGKRGVRKVNRTTARIASGKTPTEKGIAAAGRIGNRAAKRTIRLSTAPTTPVQTAEPKSPGAYSLGGTPDAPQLLLLHGKKGVRVIPASKVGEKSGYTHNIDIGRLHTTGEGLYGAIAEAGTYAAPGGLGAKALEAGVGEAGVKALLEGTAKSAAAGKAATTALKDLTGAGAKKGAEEGAAAAARATSKRAVAAVSRAAGAARGAIKRVDHLTSVRKWTGRAVAEGGGRAAKDLPEGAAKRAVVRSARVGKGAAKVASAPIRHPGKTAKVAFGAQVPIAVGAGDPHKLLDPLTGGGFVAGALNGLGSVANSAIPGVAGNAVQDVVDLPAQAVPSLYLPAAGLVEAAQGDPARLQALWQDYKDTGVIPHLVSGDVGGALHAAGQHPVLAALELSGAKAVLGRGAGAALRRAPSETLNRVASESGRKPLEIGGGMDPLQRGYSPDLINKGVQVAADIRRERKMGGQRVTTSSKIPFRGGGEFGSAMRTGADYAASAEEGVRRADRSEEATQIMDTLKTGKRGLTGRYISKTDRAGVAFAVMGIIKNAKTFHEDLARYGHELDANYVDLLDRAKSADLPEMQVALRARGKLNREMRDHVDTLLEKGNPQEIVRVAHENARALQLRDAELQAQGHLDPAEADQARLKNAAMFHLGAKVDKPNMEGYDQRVSVAEKQVNSAEAGIRQAEKNVRRAEGDLRRTAAEGKPATPRQVQAADRARAQLKWAKNRAKEAKAEHSAARKARAGMHPGVERLVDQNGTPLHGERLHAELRKVGVEPNNIGFVSTKPNLRGAGNFYKGPFFPTRKTLTKQVNTGTALAEGTWDPSFEALAEDRLGKRGTVSASKSFDRVVNEFRSKVGGKNGDGIYRGGSEGYKAAEAAAAHPEALGFPAGTKMRVVRVDPFRASTSEAQAATDAQLAGQMGGGKLLENAWHEAQRKPDAGTTRGNYAVMPEQVADRLITHMRGADRTRRFAQQVSTAFKSTILPLSPNWFLGNIVDVSIRSMFSGVGPRDNLLGRKILKQLDSADPEAAKRFRAMYASGTLYGSADRTTVFRDAQSYANTSLSDMATATALFRKAPGIKTLGDLWKTYVKAAYHFNEKFIEQQAGYAVLGKVGRNEVRRTTGKWLDGARVQQKALTDLAEGLKGTQAQIRFGKQYEDILGNWTRLSPSARAVLADYAPFGLWARAASKFVFVTLPLKHPIKTAIIAAAYEMTDKERDALGLSYFAPHPLPAWLQGSIPTSKGLITPQSITSVGFTDNYLSNLSSMVLPQIPLNELQGQDWKGSPLTNADGSAYTDPQKVLAAIETVGGSMIPFVGLAQRWTGLATPGQSTPQGASALVPSVFKPKSATSSSSSSSSYGSGTSSWGPSTSSSSSSGSSWGPSSSSTSSAGSWGP